MELNGIYDDTLGTLLLKMRRAGVGSVAEFSEAMHHLRRQQLVEGIFSHAYCTSSGSDAQSYLGCVAGHAPKDCIIWSINHYLGLNRHPYVIDKVIEAVKLFGTGSGTSAMSGGKNSLHYRIEEKVREWMGKDGVILFPTGYSANLGLMSALCQANDHVLIDEESHASIRDGVRLSQARRAIPFAHNSVADLERRLALAARQNKGKIIVVVESAYSMSGDICPLRNIVALKDRYDFFLVVDEAHSFGIYGESGRGICFREGVVDRVDAITSTFSKATAAIGGFVATDAKLVSYLQWAASSYSFQACFPPGDSAAILASMEVIEQDPGIAAQLHDKNRYMRSRLRESGFDLGTSETPIIPIYVNVTSKLLRICFELFKEGIFSVPVTTPVVEAHEGRIRFILNVRHTYEHIDKTVTLLNTMARKYDLYSDQEEFRHWVSSGRQGEFAVAG